MPGVTTLATARVEMLGKVSGIVPELSADRVTSAVGNAGGTTAQINSLGNYPDSYFEDAWWLILEGGPTGSGSLEARLVSTFAQDDGSGNTIVTVREAFSAQVASGVTAYLSPFHPELVRESLNEAAVGLWPTIFAYRRGHHVGRSYAFNGFWDFWSGGLPVWWAKSNSLLTVAQLTEPYFGEFGVTLTADGAGARYLKSTPISPAILNILSGQDITLHAILRGTTASEVGISISDGAGDGATVFHDGDGEWTEIETAARTMEVSRPGSPIEFRIHVITSAVGHIGPVWTTGGQRQRRLPVVPVFRRAPENVKVAAASFPSFQEDMEEVIGWHVESHHPAVNTAGVVGASNELIFDDDLPTGRLAVFEGSDYLNQCSAETDTYEVDDIHATVLYTLALESLNRKTLNIPQAAAVNLDLLRMRDWEDEARELLKQPGVRMPRPVVSLKPPFVAAPAGVRNFRLQDD